jgi:transposase
MTKEFTELTDPQWAAISPFLTTTRKRKHDLRQIMNALLFILRTGLQWRNLPKTWPHWQAVYYYFDIWKKDETLTKISLALTRMDRKEAGRAADPEILSVDSQSVKLSPRIFEDRGLDPNKRVNGRKRQFMVDSGGRLWVIRVHAANGADGPEAIPLIDEIVLDEVAYIGERLKKVVGDQSYNGVFAAELTRWGIGFEKAARPESAQGFVPVAKRWVVERTISWTNYFRRLIKDYEYTVSSSVGWLYLGNIQLMLQRILSLNQI